MNKPIKSNRFSKYIQTGKESWIDVIEEALLEDENLYLPELAKEIFNNYDIKWQERSRQIIYRAKKRIEKIYNETRIACNPEKTYSIIHEKAEYLKESDKRNRGSKVKLDKFQLMIVAMVRIFPELLPDVKKMVWALMDTLRHIEMKQLKAKNNEIPRNTSK